MGLKQSLSYVIGVGRDEITSFGNTLQWFGFILNTRRQGSFECPQMQSSKHVHMFSTKTPLNPHHQFFNIIGFHMFLISPISRSSIPS